LRRLEKLFDDKVLQVANLILADVTNDPLQSAVEQRSNNELVSDITRQRMAKALDGFSLTGTADPPHDFRMKHWPEIWGDPTKVYAIAINNYIITEEILKLLGFFDCSQVKMSIRLPALIERLDLEGALVSTDAIDLGVERRLVVLDGEQVVGAGAERAREEM
jgi:hypothetical protein